MERDIGALYVYDRVCSKKAKEYELYNKYGRGKSGSPMRNPSDRVYGRNFAASQHRRAEAYHGANGKRRYGNGPQRARVNSFSNGNVYNYRPGRASGGEAVKSRHFKIVLDKIINLFESVEERGKRDEIIAKKNAIDAKKFLEYRRAIFTAILLVLVVTVFSLLVYKLFFVVDDVNITGSDIYSTDEILDSAGISVGDNLYSFSASEAENSITFSCPYIKSVNIKRTIPKTVAIDVSQDSAVYFAEIYGDLVKLSAGLRVLEVVSREDAAKSGLVELILPPVDYAVAGRVISFVNERHDRVIRDILGMIEESSLMNEGMVGYVNLSDEYEVEMHSLDKYILNLGGEADMDLKLRMAYKTITSDAFDKTTPASIDLTIVGKASVRYDPLLQIK